MTDLLQSTFIKKSKHDFLSVCVTLVFIFALFTLALCPTHLCISLNSIYQWQNGWSDTIIQIPLKSEYDCNLSASNLDVGHHTLPKCATHLYKIILKSIHKWRSYGLHTVQTKGQRDRRKNGCYKIDMPSFLETYIKRGDLRTFVTKYVYFLKGGCIGNPSLTKLKWTLPLARRWYYVKNQGHSYTV
jgi:hypothetical protein